MSRLNPPQPASAGLPLCSTFDYAARTEGVRVHAVNGTADHIHLAISIPPTLNTSEWLGKLKGAGTHHVNHRLINRRTFGWQLGYGVLSFGTKDLPWVVE